jgi:hypothetical protein
MGVSASAAAADNNRYARDGVIGEGDAESDDTAEGDLDQTLDRGLRRAGVAVRHQEHDDRGDRRDPVARPPRDQRGERKQRRRPAVASVPGCGLAAPSAAPQKAPATLPTSRSMHTAP